MPLLVGDAVQDSVDDARWVSSFSKPAFELDYVAFKQFFPAGVLEGSDAFAFHDPLEGVWRVAACWRDVIMNGHRLGV